MDTNRFQGRYLMAESLKIDRTFLSKKPELLSYLRHRATEYLTGIKTQFGESQFKERAAAINQALIKERDKLVAIVRQEASRDRWDAEETLSSVLLLMHCNNVVMIESRNEQWPYEYMTFSRRVGEIWEPFCATCFVFPVRNDISLFIPPLFQDVKNRVSLEVREFIENLSISPADKESLLRYYDQVWQLVASGEINLELDLHLEINGSRVVVDFKSGFGSNEKGNTNRLLLVASIYKNIEPEDYRCVLLVRSPEDENNHYLQTLKNSGL